MTDYTKDLPLLEDCGFTKRVVFFDTETSGFHYEIPDVCVLEIGAVLMELDGSIGSKFEQVICPNDALMATMRPGALAVNGFSEGELRERGIPMEDAWGNFAAWLKDHKVVMSKTQLVAHNAVFDTAFLWQEAPAIARKYGWVYGQPRVRDNMALYSQAQSKFIVPYISASNKGKSSKNIALQLGVAPEPDMHRALEGALLNYRIFTNIAQRTRKWLLEEDV